MEDAHAYSWNMRFIRSIGPCGEGPWCAVPNPAAFLAVREEYTSTENLSMTAMEAARWPQCRLGATVRHRLVPDSSSTASQATSM